MDGNRVATMRTKRAWRNVMCHRIWMWPQRGDSVDAVLIVVCVDSDSVCAWWCCRWVMGGHGDRADASAIGGAHVYTVQEL